MAYIPGGALFAGALAELISCTTNRYTGMAGAAPAYAGLEVSLLRWMCALFGLPAGALGTFTTGGSMANFSAVVTARHVKLGEDFRDATLYVTEHAHHSVAKAARLAGLPAAALRTVPTDDRLRMDPEALAEMLAADPRPFLVVASAGTTSTGAIDPLEPVADVARRFGVWLHVDAAYGGFFALTERGRARLAGIERADSITLDPHKGLSLPYGNGVLLVRDFEQLGAAHSVGAEYLQDLAGAGAGLPDPASYSAELTRGFRGLRMWLPLHLHGVGAFRAALDEKLDLTEWLQGELAADERLDIPWPAELSVISFRLRDGDDAANRAFQDRINGTRRIFLSSTVIGGRYTLRACILSAATGPQRVREAAELIRQAAARPA
jgi:aromatic-L-amino-acid decarboxylase